jgi:hypothetical protein
MILGLNCDDIGMLDRILPILSGMRTRPVLGVVADPEMSAESLRPAAQRLAAVADILWRPFDSSSLITPHGHIRYTTQSYEQRAEEFCRHLGKFCGSAGGIECGNEITLPANFVGPGIAHQTRAAVERCQVHAINSYVCYFFDGDAPRTMADLAHRWLIPSTFATVSIYPNSYSSNQWHLDDIFHYFEHQLPGIPKLVGEFGSENAAGRDPATAEEHFSMVRAFLSIFRPKIPNYQVGGFEWDWTHRTLDYPLQEKFYRGFEF